MILMNPKYLINPGIPTYLSMAICICAPDLSFYIIKSTLTKKFILQICNTLFVHETSFKVLTSKLNLQHTSVTCASE